MKIKINESDLKEIKQKAKRNSLKGLVFAIALTSLGVCVGCSNNTNKQVENNDISTENNIEDDKNGIYDFIFTKTTEEKTEKSSYDWSQTEDILKAKDENFANLIKVRGTRYVEIENYKYNLAFYQGSEASNNYIRIVDNNGNYLTDIKFKSSIYFFTKDDSVVIENKENSDTVLKQTYTVFNCKNGNMSNIEATYMYTIDNYIISYNYENNNNKNTSYFELYHYNGELASNEKYSHITANRKNNLLYLSKDENTEVINLKTNKAKKIEGEVIEAENGYVVLEKNQNQGVYYLDTLEKDPEKIISSSFDNIDIVIYGDEPVFSCGVKKEENKMAKFSLFSHKGKQISTKEYDFIYQKDLNYICGVEEISSANFDLINKYGAIEIEDINASSIKIVDDKIVIFQQPDEVEKWGIMDFNKKILLEPKFEYLNVDYYYDIENNYEIVDYCIYGQLGEDTMFFDKDLNLLESGKYDDYREIQKKINRILNTNNADLSTKKSIGAKK